MLNKLKDFCQTVAFITVVILSFIGVSIIGLLYGLLYVILHGISVLINGTD